MYICQGCGSTTYDHFSGCRFITKFNFNFSDLPLGVPKVKLTVVFTDNTSESFTQIHGDSVKMKDNCLIAETVNGDQLFTFVNIKYFYTEA